MDLSNNLKNIYYINLDKRIDRKFHIENQLKTINATATRFSAISRQNGALGCSLSHLSLVKYAKRRNLDYIVILEDDVTFLNPGVFLNSLNNFMEKHKDFDVLLLAGNNMGNYTKIDDHCVKVTHCQTTTAYLVKNHYYDTLIENYENGINLLQKFPHRKYDFAIDQYWGHLQRRDNWYLLTPLTVVQRPDVSDIEKRQMNYTTAMLDLDKITIKQKLDTIKSLRSMNL